MGAGAGWLPGGRQPLDFIRPPVTDWTLMEPLCRLTTLALLAISGTLLAATEPAINYNIHLWEPGKVPLATGEGPLDSPFVTVFLPAPEKRNGSAVIVAPGGSNIMLMYGAEGVDIAERLND